mgnify:CR=1 FL=1
MAVRNSSERLPHSRHFPTAEELGISPEDAKFIALVATAALATLAGMGLFVSDFQNRQQQIPPVPTQTSLPNTYDPRSGF